MNYTGTSLIYKMNAEQARIQQQIANRDMKSNELKKVLEAIQYRASNDFNNCVLVENLYPETIEKLKQKGFKVKTKKSWLFDNLPTHTISW